MNIKYLINFLWKKKWTIIIPALTAAIIGWVLTIHMKADYTSVAELSTGYLDLNPLQQNPNPNNTVLFNNVIQTLTSDQILDQVSYKLLQHELQNPTTTDNHNKELANRLIKSFPKGKSGLIATLNNKIDSFNVLNLANLDDRRIRELSTLYGYSPNSLSKQIEVARINYSDFISIKAKTDNPELSATIANLICQSFLLYYHNAQNQASTSSLDTLKNMVAAKKQILDNKLKMLQGNGDLTVSSSLGLLGNLQGLLTEQKNNLIAAQVSLENTNQLISQNNKQGGLAGNEDIIAIRTNIDNLWAKYVNSGSNDINLLNQIKKLRETLQQKLSEAGTGNLATSPTNLLKQKADLEVKIKVAKETMKDLENKINSLNGSVQSSSSQEGILTGVQNEVEMARQEYVNANTLYNQALNRNIFPGNNFKQTLIASPPLNPEPVSRLKIIFLSALGVFSIIIFSLLFLEFVNPAIKSPSLLKEYVGPIPLLANLNLLGTKQMSLQNIFNNDNNSKRLSNFKEQIKQVRYEVENSGKKIFLISSYHKNSGKSMFIQFLAGSLSLINKKILLIDCNFANNQLTKVFNAPAAIEDPLESQHPNSLSLEIQQKIHSTEFHNIQVIGCKTGNYTPDEILPVNNILYNLKNFPELFDYAFIDCASTEEGPDEKELLKYVDATILLFSADNQYTNEDKKLVAFLSNNKDQQVIGSVLNKIKDYNISL